MDLNQAIARIERSLEKMAKAYHRPVFDEWAIISLERGNDRILHVVSPRENPAATFAHDFRILRAESQAAADNPGDFGITKEAKNDAIDAYIVLGERLIMIANDTGRSMTEVTADPLWQAVQPVFFNLCEAFRADPLSL